MYFLFTRVEVSQSWLQNSCNRVTSPGNNFVKSTAAIGVSASGRICEIDKSCAFTYRGAVFNDKIYYIKLNSHLHSACRNSKLKPYMVSLTAACSITGKCSYTLITTWSSIMLWFNNQLMYRLSQMCENAFINL